MDSEHEEKRTQNERARKRPDENRALYISSTQVHYRACTDSMVRPTLTRERRRYCLHRVFIYSARPTLYAGSPAPQARMQLTFLVPFF